MARSGKQPARGPRPIPAIGVPSNVGPQRDYMNSLSGSSTEKVPMRSESEFAFMPNDNDGIDTWELMKRRNRERD